MSRYEWTERVNGSIGVCVIFLLKCINGIASVQSIRVSSCESILLHVCEHYYALHVNSVVIFLILWLVSLVRRFVRDLGRFPRYRFKQIPFYI